MNETGLETFSRLLSELKHEVRVLGDHLALRNRIEHLTQLIMTLAESVNAFIPRQEAHNAKIGANIDGIVTAVDNIVVDVGNLNTTIEELKALLGDVSPEIQQKLDALDATATSLETNSDAAKAKADAADALTPPKPPVV